MARKATLFSSLFKAVLNLGALDVCLDHPLLRAVLCTGGCLSAPPDSAHTMPSSPTAMRAESVPQHRQMSPGGGEGGKITLKESQIKDIIMPKRVYFKKKKIKREITGFKGARKPCVPVDNGINVS